MTTYAWPGFPVNHFEMRIVPNTRLFTGPYTPTTQVIDLLGERWMIVIGLAPMTDPVQAAAIEAYFDRLKGPANWIQVGHLKRPRPQGTFGPLATLAWTSSAGAMAWTSSAGAMSWTAGSPFITGTIQQLGNTCVISTTAGRTLLAGDQLSIGGQLVRAMANATADVNGNMTVEFQPRARNLIPALTGVFWDTPQATFILKPGTPNVPTPWKPGLIEGASFELIEAF